MMLVIVNKQRSISDRFLIVGIDTDLIPKVDASVKLGLQNILNRIINLNDAIICLRSLM